MKHLNFLSKSSSQSCSHSSVTLASTVGSPSVDRRGTMLKLLSVLVLIFTFGIGQMWGADPTESFSGSSFSTQGTQGSGSSYTITGTNLSINDDKFYGGSNNTYAQSYAGSKMTCTPNSGITIKK